jgi:hypothetical protein
MFESQPKKWALTLNLQLSGYLNLKQLRTGFKYLILYLYEFVLLQREKYATFKRFGFSYSILFFGNFCEIVWQSLKISVCSFRQQIVLKNWNI